jgi:hypothetical protein
MLRQGGRSASMDIADEENLQRDPFIEHVLGKVA